MKDTQKTRYIEIVRRTLPFLAFAIPFIMLYLLYPSSFEATWKGRTYYLFFLWLFLLEMIMSSAKPEPMEKKPWFLKAIFVLSLFLPTMYVVTANYSGLNTLIVNEAGRLGVGWPSLMPLSTEYLVLAMLFTLIVSLNYGISNLADFPISIFFLGTIGAIYTIDNLYPYGNFTPFQLIVPTTAFLAMGVLNLMGYHTVALPIDSPDKVPYFIASNAQGQISQPLGIAWACSGVESLIIYTITILLFLRRSTFSYAARTIYFVIGAVITYFINILRIATLFIISVQGGDIGPFHDYYGQLYSISWILSYPLIMIGSQLLWSKITKPSKDHKDSKKL
jgi:thaumarchaeosortase